MNERLKDAGQLLADANTDAILVWNMANVRYLSGFTGSEAALLIGRETLFFLTDSRYKTQAENQKAKFEIRISNDKTKSIASALEGMGAKTLAFEDETLTVRQKALLTKAMPNVEFIALGSKLDDLRLQKDSSELDIMREAALISEKGFQKAIETIRPGVSEKKVATELEIGMLRNGASGPSFETIVASGHRGSLPHGVASAKLIEKGELIVIDFGCVYRGYCSDQTVTVACGDIGQEEEKVFDIVREAQANAIEALKPGVRLKDVDAIARNFISQAGYGDYFGHGLGHGVGMNVHEAPRLNSESETIAKEGMVITVEPGIYLPGRFGVRIEDTLVVTATGCQRITNLDKSLRRL